MEKRISRCGSSFWLKHRVRLSELWVLCGEDEVARGREEAAAELGIKCSNALILAWPTNLCVVTFGSQEVKELWLSTLLRQRRGAREPRVTRLASIRLLAKVVGVYNHSVTLTAKTIETLISVEPAWLKIQRRREAVGRALARAKAQRRTQPPTPELGAGRAHAEGHTELHAEEPLKHAVLVHVASQAAAPADTPRSPLSAQRERGRDVATQVGQGELHELDFDAEVQPLVEDLVEKAMEKVFAAIQREEEEELAKLQPLEAADGELPCAGCAEPQRLEEREKQGQEEKAQNGDGGGTSALGPAGTAAAASEVAVQLEGGSDSLPEGPERTEAVVVAVPGTPEAEEETPALDSRDQAWAQGAPGEAAPPQGEPGLPALQSTEVPAAELAVQKEMQASALTPETTGSEAAAAAGQSVTEGACVQVAAKGPILEPPSAERTTREGLPQSDETAGGTIQGAVLQTETPSQRGNSEGSKLEDAVLSGDSAGSVPAAPAQLEGDDLSA
ncbi:uncharacterized protein [Struthio camelus]|uniref:uncharacterized protein n=2 Tax=Struthio camelus TaxID=8801 RepID=UPI003603F540